MQWLTVFIFILIVTLSGLALLGWVAVHRRLARREEAVANLCGSFESLGEAFRVAAQATGKPRGLAWKRVSLGPRHAIAIDRSGCLVALVEAEIAFEAIAGGGMEEVAAVSNLRSGTALFQYMDGQWTTEGRTVFNHTPDEALRHFAGQLTEVAATNARRGDVVT